MITRITLKNFMAHADTDLRLVEGLNVIIGPNNSGKSAIVTALMILSTLPTREGDYMIRHGEKNCSITVETEEGDVLTWRRTRSSSPVLSINGEDLTRLGNDQAHALSRLQPLLRLPQVAPQDGGGEFDVHLATQKEPIFLLGRESQAAMFFASSSDAERLLQMQKLFKDRVREKKHERTRSQRERAMIGEELETLLPLDDLKPLLTELQERHQDITAAAGREQILAESARELDELGRRHADLQQVLQPLCHAQPPPLPQPEQPLLLLHEGLSSALVRQADLAAEHDVCSALMNPPEVRDVRDLARVAREMSEALESRRMEDSANGILEKVGQPPEVSDPAPFERDLRSLRVEQAHHEIWSSRLRVLRKLPEPPDRPDPTPLEELLTQIQMEGAAADTVRTERDAAEIAFQQWIASHPTCPHCGSRLDADQVPGGAHVH